MTSVDSLDRVSYMRNIIQGFYIKLNGIYKIFLKFLKKQNQKHQFLPCSIYHAIVSFPYGHNFLTIHNILFSFLI